MKMKAEGWLVLRCERGYGSGTIRKVKVGRVTQSKPNNLDGNELAVKIDLLVDPEWFNDPMFVVQVELPEHTEQDPVTISADVSVPSLSV